ncbi:MAG: Tim44/TimA family putative adaptor protein [Candidatus Pelagibacter sp.]|tara:strand:- start:25 stop:612 length:588 start_codon:yes stop_codon:yes gene_type:complete
MSYSFEYIDIILLAMIAGFIFLRLRGILGKKTGFEKDINSDIAQKTPTKKYTVNPDLDKFDDSDKKEFLNGAKIAYENIITSFSRGKILEIKSLLDINVYKQFDEAIKDRSIKNISSETTFVGINSAEIKHHQKNKNMLEVTVEFVSEIISCMKDKNNKIISGDPDKIKKVHDIWKFSRDVRSTNPNWFLIDTQA